MSMFAVIDLETTGFAARGSDRIVEIGVVITDGHGSVDAEWSTLINPRRELRATKIHGITAEMVADAPTFGQIAGELADVLAGRVLVAHNAQFDMGFLHAEWSRNGESPTLDAFDTMKGAARIGLPAKLSLCCQALGIQILDAHRALGDARTTALLLGYLNPSESELPGAFSGLAASRGDSDSGSARIGALRRSLSPSRDRLR